MTFTYETAVLIVVIAAPIAAVITAIGLTVYDRITSKDDDGTP